MSAAKEPAADAKPEGIRPSHLRDGAFGRHASPLSFLILLAVVGLGASGFLGKPWAERSHASGAAELEIEMPAVISTGDLYEMRILVRARHDISRLQIAIDRHLWKETTVNSMVPAADSEQFKEGSFRFVFDGLQQGEEMVFKVDAQINPRFAGLLAGDIRVLDDGHLLVTSRRQLRVLP